MCGISGFLAKSSKNSDELSRVATRMSNALEHRGPDSDGVWVDPDAGIALSHRRLAIVDLTETGAQPMQSACSNWVLVYNGEIYNTQELRNQLELEGSTFRGNSDTEVILEGIAQWGIIPTINKLIGMFSLAVWNKRERVLTLVRDRLGIKPVFWTKTENGFIFGSEIKALKQHQDCPTEIDPDAINGYLRSGYISAPKTIYKKIQKLMPGWILHYRLNGEPSLEQYWSLSEIAKASSSNQFRGSEAEAEVELESLISDAVTRRMIADVPLGAFLSGGIDSSLVVALMQQKSSNPVKTFSIGFHEKEFDEALHAADVAKHLGTEHTELYVSSKDAMEVIPKLNEINDEPFGDVSQIPTYLVSKLTKNHVTVALSGDGGDELFTGYGRYFKAMKYRGLRQQPKALRHLEASIAEKLPLQNLGKLDGVANRMLAIKNRERLPHILRSEDDVSLYRRARSRRENPENHLIAGTEYEHDAWHDAKNIQFKDPYCLMQYIDTLDYLPDDILTKVDRASMAVSLEARVPLLDHRIVEYAWSLPTSFKVDKTGKTGKTGKRILKNILSNHIPNHMIDRPKKGFSVPMGIWIKGPLREWAEDLLSVDSLKQTNIFIPESIRQTWNDHLTGRVDWEYHLWDVLCLQSWAMAQYKKDSC